MIDISKGRYWDLPWSLVDGCTPCSPGCDHCWSAAMTHRLKNEYPGQLTTLYRKFNGVIETHPERFSVPLKRKKPTVWSLWNDLFHEAVPITFIDDVFEVIAACPQHTFLILTKRAHLMEEKIYGNEANAEYFVRCLGGGDYLPNVYWGLTVCNQQEADEKIPVFLKVPGKKFLSIEPMLGPINFVKQLCLGCGRDSSRCDCPAGTGNVFKYGGTKEVKPHWPIDAVILGGETGPGARPMELDWVRSVHDQCAAAGVPFFFKSWGKWGLNWMNDANDNKIEGSEWMDKGIRPSGRTLGGRTHDDLPWVKS